MTRTVITSLTFSLVVFALVVSCADSTKYRMLTFFFDGVPEPGQARLAAEAATPSGAPAAGAGEATVRPEPLLRYIAHPPYRDNQCGRCHDPQGGQLLATIQEGLCLVCHAKVAAEPKHLHGPVAVNDCGVCHHYHESRYPSLLLTDATATCLVCHDRDDLTTPAPGSGQAGDHHADLERRTCIECHHPHGGSDKFFLKRTGP